MAGAANYEIETMMQRRAEPKRGRRGFWALIATQFQGAFSDNILRNLLLSEWTKLRSVRSTYWTTILAALLTVGLGAGRSAGSSSFRPPLSREP